MHTVVQGITDRPWSMLQHYYSYVLRENWCWKLQASLLLQILHLNMPDIFPAKQLSQIIITYWNTERIMAYLTTQQSLIVTLQELYIVQRLWRGPDWSCHSTSFPSNTKENALNGDRIWLVGFVPVDENISLSVLINTALCPCPVLLCLITSSALLSSQVNFKVFSKYLLESFLEHRWITGFNSLGRL